jgi:23S rRNA pseudouridine1911/1915/1917 synthase
MSAERHFVVQHSARLDRAVVEAMPELSRSQVRRLVEDGSVRVGGEVTTKPAHTVHHGAELIVAEPTVPNLDWQSQDVPLDIIFEDEETLILNKPSGIIVHPRPSMNAVTLINAVRARYPEVREIDDSGRGGVVHRLDRDTSGVIAFAKSAAAQYALKEQWRERETLKRYLAVVRGFVDPSHGMIEAPLGPDPNDPRRRAVVEQGQSARSEFEVLEQFDDEAALVSVRIYTGRTHQIRVHMAAIGHSILGDQTYGRPSDLIERQALHARLLGLTLPSSGEWREFEAQPPADFQQLLETLRRRHSADSSAADASNAAAV